VKLFTEIIIPIVLFVAAAIRGYTGFGFAAIATLILSTSYPVVEVVPAVLMTDLLIGLPLLATCWQGTDWQKLTPLLRSTFIGVPIGLAILAFVTEPNLRILVPATILFLALLPYLKNQKASMLLSSPLVCGVMSGWTTSAVSSGGAPVVIHLRHSNLPLSRQRHTLIVYFFVTTCLVLGLSYAVNKRFYFLPEEPVLWSAISLAGAIVGKLLFSKVTLPAVHHLSYYLLLLLSFWGLINAAITFH
jgi:uncharacterized membrane protein YfcA